MDTLTQRFFTQLLEKEQTIEKPYSSNSQLPPAVRDNLPESAQSVFRAAFNSALAQYGGDETRAFKVAWAAVRNAGFTQNSEGKWVKKANDAAEGAMLATFLDEATAENFLEGIPEDIAEPADNLHLTYAYFGKADELDDATKAKISRVASTLATSAKPLQAEVTGWARFTGPQDADAVVALVGTPDLPDFRRALTDALEEEGVEFSKDFAFIPHVTVAYMSKDDAITIPGNVPENFSINNLTVAMAGEREVYKVGGDDAVKAMYGITKANEEKRYTLGPVYLPGKLDAHNEFIEDDDLHEAIWKYVKKDDRRIHLQHTDEIVGEWVEIMRWPYDATAELHEPQDGGGVKKTKMKFPAGTVFMGVLWQPRAWDLIKTGKVTGYSIGGKAQRMEVEFS